MSIPEENTLGVIIGSRPHRGATNHGRRITGGGSARASLGTGFIAVGAAVIVTLGSIAGIGWLIGQWSSYPNPYLALAAWALLAVSVVATFITTRVVGDLPSWMFAILLLGLAAASALDLYAIWPLHDIGRYATASAAAGMALLVAITFRPPKQILAAGGALGAAMASAMLVNSSLGAQDLAAQVTTLASTILPAVIGVVVITGFERLVQVELDRVLVQSTVSAPRFAVGMLASEELARLDLAAEELLDSVATGRVALPLDPKTASTAASLATELRLHLIEGRRETWLYHAISESELLGKSVTLTDKGSLAGLLDSRQRDGLLSTAWLLVSDTSKPHGGRTAHITVGTVTPPVPAMDGNGIMISIVLTTTGVPRNRVDPATWEAIGRVGQYSDSTQNSSVRVDISCRVSSPADQ